MPRIYFDNLASAVTGDDLKRHFSKAGEVRGVLLVTDKASGKSRGFGCVDMVRRDDAAYAIKWLNHADLKGRKIRIAPLEARADEPDKRKPASTELGR